MKVGEEFLDKLFGAGGVLDRALGDENLKNIARAARIVSNARKVWCFGTGHSFLLGQAMLETGRDVNLIEAQGILMGHGMMDSTYYEDNEKYTEFIKAQWLGRINKSDAVIIASNSGNNKSTVGLAEALRDRGAPVVGITSFRHSWAEKPKTVSGKKLFEVAEIHIDNGGVHGDALLSIPGVLNPTAASSTVMGLMLEWILLEIRELKLDPDIENLVEKIKARAEKVRQNVRESLPAVETAAGTLGRVLSQNGVIHAFGFGPAAIPVEESSYRAGGAFPVNVFSYHRNLRYSNRNFSRGYKADDIKTAARIEGWMNYYFNNVRPFHDNDAFVSVAMDDNEMNRHCVEPARTRSIPLIALRPPSVPAPDNALLIPLKHSGDRLEMVMDCVALMNILMAGAMETAAGSGHEIINYLSGNVQNVSKDYETRRALTVMKYLPYLTGFFNHPDPQYTALFNLVKPAKHGADLLGWRMKNLLGGR